MSISVRKSRLTGTELHYPLQQSSLDLKRKRSEIMRLLILVLLMISYLSALAGEADVLDVDVSCNNDSICRFDVTVKHNDEGWKHYANRWEILSPGGEVLATRELAHPHDHEQPFTRSLANVKIPSELSAVIVRAHDLIHEYGGKEIVVELPD